MVGLQKQYIKKYGISRRAWAAQRAEKRSTPSNPRRKTRMRRSYSGGIMARKTRHIKKSFSSKINELAIVATAFIEPYVDSVINSFSSLAGGLTSILKLVAAYFLKKKGGMIGSIAQTIYVIEIYKLARTFVGGGGISGLLGNIGNSSVPAYA